MTRTNEHATGSVARGTWGTDEREQGARVADALFAQNHDGGRQIRNLTIKALELAGYWVRRDGSVRLSEALPRPGLGS